MLRAPRARISAVGGPALFAVLCAGLVTRCSDPQRPVAGSASAFEARWDNGTLEFNLDGTTAGNADLTLVATQLQFDAVTEVLRAEIALRNRGDRTAAGPESVVLYGFVPASVRLLDAACGAPLAAGECAIDYRSAYGADGVLAPGETSTPVVWRLQVPAGQSFAFRARLGETTGAPGTIAGVVFADVDQDGVRDLAEPGVAGVRVRVRAAAGSDDVRTDAQGRYAFLVTEPGIYDITADLNDGEHSTTVLPLHVTILRQAGGALASFTQGDIGLAAGPAGPTVTVEGLAFADLDRDGQRDVGEPGIAALKIRGRACDRLAKTAGDDDDFETRTDSTGYYRLALPDCGGPWEVSGGSVDHSDRTTPKDIVFVARPEPGTLLRADFGYAPEDPSSAFEIRGVVFRDDDGDGIRDLGELPLAGVLVTADGIDCTGPAFAADRTDERGRYKLEGQDIACPLPWQVERAGVLGGRATTPASVRLTAAPLFSREFTVDFGVQLLP